MNILRAVAAAVAVFSTTAAFAVGNAGFEAGTTNDWFTFPAGALTAATSGTVVDVIDDAYHSSPTPVESVAIDAVEGNWFGLLTMNPAVSSASFSVNASLGTVGSNDYFWMRLLSPEYDAGFNDSATVSFYGTNTLIPLATYTWSALDTIADGYFPDPGWRGYAVPIDALSLTVTLNNVGDKYNLSTVALDYSVVAPVPEPQTYAMMLAGLGAVGFMARRRGRNRL
jgi:hypothetical protein